MWRYNGDHYKSWKGDLVGYKRLHFWLRRKLPKPSGCVDCGESKPLEVANISQTYKRDLEDWEWLCRRCHMVKDGRISNLVRNQHPKRYAKCGRPIVSRKLNICMQQYNYLRRSHTGKTKKCLDCDTACQ